MPTHRTYIDAIRTESARFREVLAGAPDRTVPTCPDWSTDDLLWHLAEVQWMWGTIVGDDTTPEGHERPERPAGRAGLLAAFDINAADLLMALAGVQPQAPRWMWAQDKALHTAGYIARRQAHEALIHRVDAELTAGAQRAGIDTDLAADGVDEVVEVMYGRDRPLLTFAPTEGRVVELIATDVDRRWVLQLGRETGTAPGNGQTVDDANFRRAPDNTPATATVRAAAADLDLWLWNRPADVQRTGDAGTLDHLAGILGDGLE